MKFIPVPWTAVCPVGIPLDMISRLNADVLSAPGASGI